MISPSAIKRIKYSEEQSCDFVKLLEYIIFEDDRDNEKYIVFKFKNCVAQWLHELKFVVSEFDIDNQLIQKITVSYKDAKVKESASFVPSAKYKANGTTDHIKVDIESAIFEKMEFNKGVTKELKYDYTDYKQDKKNDSIEPSKIINQKDGYIKPTFVVDEKNKNKKKKINIKNITNSNRSYKMPLFSIITSLVVIIISIFLSTYTKDYSSKFIGSGGLVYEVEYDESGKETGYVSLIDISTLSNIINITSSVSNPSNGKAYTLKCVEKGAISNTTVETIVIQSTTQIEFKENSINNCSKLKYIQVTSGSVLLDQYAVNTCKVLIKISLTSTSSYYSNSYVSCPNADISGGSQLNG